MPSICAECKQLNCIKNPKGVKEVKPEEGFKCDICGKIFKVKIALAGHKRSHK